MDQYPLANVERIFGSVCDSDMDREERVGPEEMQMHFTAFPWLSTNVEEVLLCSVCRGAFSRHPSSLIPDEWTCPYLYDHISYNTHNLILILKIHNFSENHFRAAQLLKDDLENENNTTRCDEKVSKDTEVIINSDLLKPGYQRWGRFLSKFSWLYIKEHNPGCTVCEKGVMLSKKLPFTKWSDPMCHEPMKTDQPTKLLTTHHLSKYHKTAEELVRSSSNGDSISIENIEKAISISTDDEKVVDVKPPITDHEWSKLLSKYPWLCGENGKCYGCKICLAARKVYPLLVSQGHWTDSMISFSEMVWYVYLVKKCYRHNASQGHISAEAVVRDHPDLVSPPWVQSDPVTLHSTTISNNSEVFTEDLCKMSCDLSQNMQV